MAIMNEHESKNYIAAFRKSHGRMGFDRPGEMVAAVKRAFSGADPDPRLKMMNLTTYGAESLAGDGGFAVGSETREMYDPVLGTTSLLGRFKPLVCSTNTLIIATDEASEWGSTGIVATQTAEAATITESKPAIKQVTVTLYKHAALVHISEELSEDSPAFNDYIWRRIVAKMKGLTEGALLRGDGVGEPLGLLNGPAVIAVAKEGSQTAATVNATNVAKMLGRLLPGSFSNALWIAHPTVLPQIGALGPGVYDGAGSGPHGAIYGRPLYVSEYMNPLGQQGDIMLVDPAGYIYAVWSPTNQTSIDFLFANMMKSFRASLRFGGVPILSAPVTARTGNNTLGHAVVLAVRS